MFHNFKKQSSIYQQLVSNVTILKMYHVRISELLLKLLPKSILLIRSFGCKPDKTLRVIRKLPSTHSALLPSILK